MTLKKSPVCNFCGSERGYILVRVYETSSYTYYLFWYEPPPSGKMTFLIHQESYNEQNTTESQYSLNFRNHEFCPHHNHRLIAQRFSHVFLCSVTGDSEVGACGSPTKLSMGRAPGERDSITDRMKQELCQHGWGFGKETFIQFL